MQGETLGKHWGNIGNQWCLVPCGKKVLHSRTGTTVMEYNIELGHFHMTFNLEQAMW